MPERNASTSTASSTTPSTASFQHDPSSSFVTASSSSSSSKGLSRIGPVKKLIHSFIARSHLEISSLHISSPDEHGLCAKGKIRLSHLASGPIPLVGLKVKFKEPEKVMLYQISASSPSSSSNGDSSTHSGEKKETRLALAKIQLEALTLQPGVPGSVSSEVNLRLIVDQDKHANFVNFIKDVVRADPKIGTKVHLSAQGVQVKAFGLKFGGLQLEKEMNLGGLGCLGGALIFQDGHEQDAAKAGPGGEAVAAKITTGLFETNGEKSSSRAELTKKKSKWSLRRTSLDKRRSFVSSKKDSSAITVVDPKSSVPPTSKQLEISNLEIIGGDSQKGIKVKADVTIENPAREPSLTVEPGELRFVLCVRDKSGLMSGKEKNGTDQSPTQRPFAGLIELGALSLAPMVLSPGPNTVKANGFIFLPPPPADPSDTSSLQFQAYSCGQDSIAKILQNETLNACAVASRYDSGNTGSGVSTVGWLAEAFEGTRIDARIPPLGDKVRLLDGAELRVEGAGSVAGSPIIQEPSASPSANDLKSSVARATLRNSFGVDIHVEELKVLACSSALYNEDGDAEILELGKIFAPRSQWPGLTLKKGGEPAHVSLPMEINPDPKVLIEILLKSAKSRRVNLGDPLASLLEELREMHWSEAGWSAPPKSRPSSSVGNSRGTSLDHSTTQPDPSDDLASLLSSALANLRVTAHVEATASIGDFHIPGKLKFVQRNLPIALSTATASSLLPLVGQPFVKAMVDRAEVEVSGIRVKKMDDRGILASVAIRLVNFGPLSATVRFITGLQIREEIDGQVRTIAVLECSEEVPVIAGMEKPVEVEARILLPSGPESRQLYSHFISRMLRLNSAKFGVFTEKLSAKSGGVHFETSLDKSITLEGLGGFPDLKLDDFEIVGEASAPVDGVSLSVAAPAQSGRASAVQFRGKTTLSNAGDLSIQLQKLECRLSIDGADIGQASVEGINIVSRGTCRVDVMGLAYAPLKEGESRQRALNGLSTLIENLLAGKPVTIEIHGQRGWITDSGRPVSLAWLDEALRDFSTTATVQWKGGVPVVDAVHVGCIEAVFPARGSIQIKVEEVTADYSVPFPINVGITSVQAELDIMFKDKVMGTCSAVQDQIEVVNEPASPSKRAPPPPRSPMQHQQQRSMSISSKVSSQAASGRIKLSLQTFDLNTTDENKELGAMISHAVQAGPDGTSLISLRGTAKVQLTTVLGPLNVRVELGKDHLVKVAGLDGLRTSPFQYSSLEVVSANPKYILAKLDLFLNNPSESIRVKMPDSSLNLAAYFCDAYLGDVILGGDGKGVMLNSGPIKLSDVEFRYRPASKSEPAIRPMLKQFLSGKTSTLSIRGHAKSSTNAALAQALSILDFSVDVRPIDRDILHRISVQLGMNVVTSNTIDAKYTMKNPINLDIDILQLDVVATHRSKPFGKAMQNYSKESKTNRMLLPAGNRNIANDLIINLTSPLDKLVWAFLDERGSIVLDIDIRATLDINGFIIPNFEYSQSVPLDVSGLQGVAKLLRLV